MTKPEVLYLVVFTRVERGGSFETKESAFSEIAKRCATGRIAALGDHDSTPYAPAGQFRFSLLSIAELSVTYVTPHGD